MEIIKLKRAYEAPIPSDGTRILVERLWPRGIKKTDAAIDFWLKDIAPSTELRKWYGHRTERWEAFQEKYRAELAGNPEILARLRGLCEDHTVTFVYAAKDTQRNSAVVLKDFLKQTKH